MDLFDLPERLEQIFWECGAQFGIYLEHLDTGEILQLDGDRQFPAAGTVKTAVLAAAFRCVQESDLDLHMEVDVDLDGAEDCRGPLSSMHPPLRLTVRNLAVLMAAFDDDLAARNLVRLVGMPHIRKLLQERRLRDTVLRREFDACAVKDNAADNLTTAENMGRFMAAICRFEIFCAESAKRILRILQRQRCGGEIFSWLPEGVRVAHKTGTEDMTVHDVAAIFTQEGDYVISVFSTDVVDQATGLQNLSRINRCVYEYWK